MKHRPTSHRLLIRTALAVVMAAAFTAGSVAAQTQGGLSARDVHDALTAQGYTDIDDIEFDDGMWEAEARRSDGTRVDVRVDARTGTVYPEDGTTALSMADIEASLASAGYSRVHDVRFDDGLWEADAFDAQGVEWELYLDPRTGDIVGKEED